MSVIARCGSSEGEQTVIEEPHECSLVFLVTPHTHQTLRPCASSLYLPFVVRLSFPSCCPSSLPEQRRCPTYPSLDIEWAKGGGGLPLRAIHS